MRGIPALVLIDIEFPGENARNFIIAMFNTGESPASDSLRSALLLNRRRRPKGRDSKEARSQNTRNNHGDV